MSKKPRILFVCTGNSARSQMAEGFARAYGGAKIDIESAGIDPRGIHPYALWVMNEAGVSIHQQTSKPLSDMDLRSFTHVVTLCGDAKDSCPIFPPDVRVEHWPLTDPSAYRGTVAEIRNAFRLSRNEIEHRVKNLLKRIRSGDVVAAAS